MKIVTNNIHYAIGKDNRYDLERVVDEVRGADFKQTLLSPTAFKCRVRVQHANGCARRRGGHFSRHASFFDIYRILLFTGKVCSKGFDPEHLEVGRSLRQNRDFGRAGRFRHR